MSEVVNNLLGNNFTNMQTFDAEINAQFANEKSRTVKICMLKHKCILMFTFLLLAFIQFVYIMLKEIKDDSSLRDRLSTLADIYYSVAVNRTNGHV
jgi:hypothetical protein